ncbi:MAG: pyruvate ferredoxin oxidoreductase, partial [Methanomicrobiales archaeon]|nr:pyruvate ferredoxin oxidoreductase [Methanomicrobiales archaeon]
FPVPDGVKLILIDATTIALKALGLPITNTTLMGAFAAASGEIKFETLENALKHRFPGELAIKNIAAAKIAFDTIKGAA